MTDEIYMQRCLDLAALGFPEVMPNPAVGCVIVNQNKIVGEGWHKKCGGPHAEVHAINSVKDKSLLANSILYVNLEPCSHHGKTPPCVDLIIKSGIKKVVMGVKDPNPIVAGKGIEKLQQAGIEVVLNVLEKKAIELNRRFFIFHLNHRPYIILKWAQTKDGFIADRSGNSKWISNEHSRILVHKWRTEEMAIMAGTNTIRTDNPMLTARDWPGKNPVRIIIDKKRSLPANMNVFTPDAKVYIFNDHKNSVEENLHYIKTEFNNQLIQQILHHLYLENIQSIIVEGGSRLLHSFTGDGLWDEARIFISDKEFGDGIKPPEIKTKLISETQINGDRLLIYGGEEVPKVWST